MKRLVVLLGILFFVAAALLFSQFVPTPLQAASGAPSTIAWQTTLNADNPLVGTIFDVRRKTFLAPAELIDQLSGTRFILLGEIHDNPDHHRLQAYVIAELAKRGRRPGIVMEQINADQAGALALFQSGRHRTAARLGPAIDWDKYGWPRWSDYQPIAEAAFDAGLKIYAGDSTKDVNRQVGTEGPAALGTDEQEQLGLNRPLGSELEAALIEDLVLSHCSMMPAERMRPMLHVQRYRDAHLARAMRQADEVDGAILIAGNGHVRSDRGVPWYLSGSRLQSQNLMIVEATADAGDPLALVPADPAGTPAADFVWITPGAKREDPCLGLKKHLKK